MTYATTSDVAIELGRPSSSSNEEAQWNAWLSRIERAISRRFTRAGLVLADQVALNAPSASDLADVEVAAVLRKIANPSSFTSVTRSVDDASLTTRREDSSVDADPLALTDAEWDILIPQTSDRGGAYTVDTASGAGVHSPWCALYFAALYCSCGADLTGYQFPLYDSYPL